MRRIDNDALTRHPDRHLALPAERQAMLDDGLTKRHESAAACRHAGPEGSRQDAGRTGGQCDVSCLQQRPLAMDEKAAVILDEEGRATSGATFCRCCQAVADWRVEGIEAAVRVYAEAARA